MSRVESSASLSLSAAISGRRSVLRWEIDDDHDEGTVTATAWRRDDWRPIHDIEPVCEYTLSPAAAELAAAEIDKGVGIEAAIAEACAKENHERGDLCPRGECDTCDRSRREIARLDARERMLEDRGDFLRDEGKDERIGRVA